MITWTHTEYPDEGQQLSAKRRVRATVEAVVGHVAQAQSAQQLQPLGATGITAADAQRQ